MSLATPCWRNAPIGYAAESPASSTTITVSRRLIPALPAAASSARVCGYASRQAPHVVSCDGNNSIV